MTVDLRKPVSRRVYLPRHGAITVTLAPEGVYFRPYRSRSAVLLPLGVGYVRACDMAAAAKLAARKAARKARRRSR